MRGAPPRGVYLLGQSAVSCRRHLARTRCHVKAHAAGVAALLFFFFFSSRLAGSFGFILVQKGSGRGFDGRNVV